MSKMIELQNKPKEKAILVAVKTPDITRERTEEYLDELEMLTETAGAETIFKITQEKARLDTASYIGKGKAEEIAELADMNDVSLIIFDDDLTGTQVKNLEKTIEKKILDRSGLILDIFAKHAKTKEAKTQVELAQLQYMLPRLTRAWTHLSKQYGGVGTKGPGETQIETDRRIIRDRISKLKLKISEIEKNQETKSSRRKEFINISLVGYTNAGKSTILNLLTDAKVLVEDKLFATLDSTTKLFEPAKNKKILLSDTVGFIRKLPHNLVASFKSTLKVVSDADILFHVIDITNPFFEDHIKVVEDTLKDLDCENKIEIKIFNKIDILEDKTKISYVRNKYQNCILLSASRGINVPALQQKILEIYDENFSEMKIALSSYESKFISFVHHLTDVIEIKYKEDEAFLHFRINNKNKSKILKALEGIEYKNY